MRDKRPVDELTIEELERILAIRRRAARVDRLRSLETQGRRLPTLSPADTLPESLAPPPQQHEAAEDVPLVEPPITYDITGDVPRFEDELEAEVVERRKKQAVQRPPAARNGTSAPVSRRRAAWDKFLLAVEVLGVIGIVAVLGVGGYFLIVENDRINKLSEKSAEVQREADAQRPTPTPPPELTVQLSNYVLPGGHYSPETTGGQAAFNVDELPNSIRPMAMAQLSAPQAEREVPQATGPVRIVISTSRVKIDASVYGGDDWETLKRGVGHYLGSANPGENGNMVLSAHNDIYGQIFRHIQYLEPGDEIRIQANDNRWYTYVVYDKQVVEPDAVGVMARGNQPIVTLITCHPYQVDNQRMVVFARLVQSGS